MDSGTKKCSRCNEEIQALNDEIIKIQGNENSFLMHIKCFTAMLNDSD